MSSPVTPPFQAFGRALVPDVELQASTLARPLVGAQAVQQVLDAAGAVYESLAIVREVVDGRRTYVETEATAFGGQQLNGIVVLTTDTHDRITAIAIHHRPLGAVLAFSAALAQALTGVVDPEHFAVPPR